MSFEASMPPYNAGDSLAVFVNASCLDFLFAELVPTTDRLAREMEARLLVAGKMQNKERQHEAMRHRLESLGYRVGQGLAERFSKDKPRFTDHLEVIKFLCKELWTLLFRKQIDNLKTNHRGVYVLSDNAFHSFRHMSTKNPSEAVILAQPYLWFPSGIIRGTLASLGIDATVHAETSELPAATFQVKTVASR